MKFIDNIKQEVRNTMLNFLNIKPATSNTIQISEVMTHETMCLKNRIFYRGDASELDQFFKQLATDNVGKGRFWAAVPSEGYIRKAHSGIYALVIDSIVDLILGDFQGLDESEEVEYLKRWEEIAKDNKWDCELLRNAITEVLTVGDGVFKFSYDPLISMFPIIEFVSGENVKIIKSRGRIQEFQFIYFYMKDKKKYKFIESYKLNSITYKLYDSNDKEVPLATLEETKDFTDVSWSGDFFLCVPMQFYDNPKFIGRGMPILERKTDNIDSLDEIISQWIDAIREGRVKNYIPEDLLPVNPETGEKLRPNSFDNKFIKTGSVNKENAIDKIEQLQSQINYDAFVNSYASFLDLVLQGIISPSTLGIDLKKTDNAEAQREKEKTTLKTRAKIVDTLTEVIPEVIQTALRCQDNLIGNGAIAEEYEVSVVFGEYASPSFNEKLEVVGKAATTNIMSIERQVDELWGDTLEDEDKELEVKRIKELKGIALVDETLPTKPIPGIDDERDNQKVEKNGEELSKSKEDNLNEKE